MRTLLLLLLQLLLLLLLLLLSQLSNDSFDVLFVSPLTRAKQTADIIAKGQELPTTMLPALREIDLYSFQVMSGGGGATQAGGWLSQIGGRGGPETCAACWEAVQFVDTCQADCRHHRGQQRTHYQVKGRGGGQLRHQPQGQLRHAYSITNCLAGFGTC